MKRRKVFWQAMVLAAAASPFLFGGVAAAGDLGFGFAPGLVAGKDFVPGQLIVGYEGLDNRVVVGTAQMAGGNVVKSLSGPGAAVLIEFGSERAALAAAKKLVRLQGVKYVERNGIIRLSPPADHKQNAPRKPSLNRGDGASKDDMSTKAVSTDPATGFQYHLTIIRKTAALPALSTTPPTVAVIDTGVDWTHPDLSGRVILGRNTVAGNMLPYDDNGHGTHVAGIIAAKAGNGSYGEGVCPKCKILAIKAMAANGTGTFFDIAQGMAYARTASTTPPTRVVNMSLGGPTSSLVADQVRGLRNAGKVLVASAGNSNSSTTLSFPGADPNTALRVMATEQQDCRAWFSNFSPKATPGRYNIAAPGWQIPSTLPEAGYGPLSGTSMASPVVAGAAALVWGQFPGLTRDQLVARLRDNGKSINCGFAAATRRVDVRRAITGTPETALIGRVLDPFTGKAPAPSTTGSKAQLLVSGTVVKNDLTDKGGFYEMTGLAAGTGRVLKALRASYVTAPRLRNNISITAGLVNGPFPDGIAFSRATGNATITLDWRRSQPFQDTTGCVDAPCNGTDLDLYVKTPAGQYIGWGNGDLLTAPFVRSGRDSWDDLEPMESVVIGSQAPNGIYRVFVDNWLKGSTLGRDTYNGTPASVQMYKGSAAFGPFYGGPPGTCGTNQYWYVGNLTKSGTAYTWTNVNTCSNTRP